MFKLTAFLLALQCLSLPVFSQTVSLSGAIKDATDKKGVKNAIVALIRQKDSVLYKFTRTDGEGNFSIRNIKPGSYNLLTTHPIYADYVDSIGLNEPQY